MKSGVYLLRLATTGKVYVGSAIDLEARRRRHFRDLHRGTHANRSLQRAYDRAPGALAFIVLELCEPNALLVTEQAYLDELYDGQRRCFNAAPVAGSMLGYRHSAEGRRALTAARRARRSLPGSVTKHGAGWRARVTINGRQVHVGIFATRSAAVAAVQDTALGTKTQGREK
jgi:group I intron endonuclease